MVRLVFVGALAVVGPEVPLDSGIGVGADADTF